MAFGIVLLDVLKLCRFIECRHIPIQVSQPLMKGRITRANITNIALEVLHVDWIEPGNGGIQPDICFGDVLSIVKRGRVFVQVGFSPVE